jgi:hypothetical protein
MLKEGVEYDEVGQDYYEKKYHESMIKNLSFRAKMLGFDLVATPC